MCTLCSRLEAHGHGPLATVSHMPDDRVQCRSCIMQGGAQQGAALWQPMAWAEYLQKAHVGQPALRQGGAGSWPVPGSGRLHKGVHQTRAESICRKLVQCSFAARLLLCCLCLHMAHIRLSRCKEQALIIDACRSVYRLRLADIQIYFLDWGVRRSVPLSLLTSTACVASVRCQESS